MNGAPWRAPAFGLTLGLLAAVVAGCATEKPRQEAAKAPFGCADPNPRPGTFCALARVKYSYLFPNYDSTRRVPPAEVHHEN